MRKYAAIIYDRELKLPHVLELEAMNRQKAIYKSEYYVDIVYSVMPKDTYLYLVYTPITLDEVKEVVERYCENEECLKETIKFIIKQQMRFQGFH